MPNIVMKLQKIKIPEFTNVDGFGSFKARNVEILFDPSENLITPENFDPRKHSYFLSDQEIERLTRESARRFFDENATSLLRNKRQFTSKEVDAVKAFFRISGAELGDLIGLDKSSISRILSEKQSLEHDKAMLLLERIREELEHPGICKITLSHLRDEISWPENLNHLCLPALKLAEFFIRKFFESDGPITDLKLQKLLYYAQGVAFGRANMKLIKEPFLAWEHGPVIREVWEHYNSHGRNPLPRDEDTDLSEIHENSEVLALLEETISLYGVYDAWYLRDKTHSESPWLETKRNDVISDKKMIRFFRKALV